MKNFLLCIFLQLFIISCTTDSEMDKSYLNSAKDQQELNVDNSVNIYDNNSQEYYKIINSYNERNGFPTDILELALQLEAVTASIGKSSPKEIRLTALSNLEVVDLIRNPEIQFKQVIENHSISPIAKMKLLELFNMLLSTNECKLITLQNKIFTYEVAVMKNEKLDTNDKKIILSISSLSKYIFLTELDRKDRDWEKAKTGRKAINIVDQRQISIANFIVAVKNLTLTIR